MYKPTHTEKDYTAEYLGQRIHEGTRQNKNSKKKKSSDKRGRKSKEGRIVRKFKVTLLPNPQQESYLNLDLQFFNSIFLYTMERLSEKPERTPDGLYHGYDVAKARKTAVPHRVAGVVPHTPKYIMDSQNALIKDSEWMKGCTYQVSYRATMQAFIAATQPQTEREFFPNGGTFEAKLCYRIVNGLLYTKKFDQLINIKESIPKGGLESIRITKEVDGGWSAIVEILEAYDKAEDIRESKKGVLETDTKTSPLLVITAHQEKVLVEKAALFNKVANTAINEKIGHRSLMDKLEIYQETYETQEVDFGLINMACVAANARIYKYRKQNTPPKISKNYIALSEGFYIKDNVLHLPKWGIRLTIKKGSRLNRGWFDYIVICRNKNGDWRISGKRQKRKIFRNLSRIFVEFSWKDKVIF